MANDAHASAMTAMEAERTAWRRRMRVPPPGGVGYSAQGGRPQFYTGRARVSTSNGKLEGAMSDSHLHHQLSPQSIRFCPLCGGGLGRREGAPAGERGGVCVWRLFIF